MRIDEVTSLGNGWYSGKGGLVFPWIFDVAVNVEFARLRVNTDNVQIDGEVETSYDEGEGSIGNTNELDYGGSTLEQGGVQFANNVEVDFTVPDMPQCEYDPETGKLVITDENGGNPQTIDVPKNDGKSSFPMEITDAEGNRYQIDLPTEDDVIAYGEDKTDDKKPKNSSQQLLIKKLTTDDLYSNVEYDRNISIDNIKYDSLDIEQKKTAIIVLKLLSKYIDDFGALTIPFKITVENMDTDNFDYDAGYNEKTNTLIFDTEFYNCSEAEQKYIVYHELAHYFHRQTYPATFNCKNAILSKHYNFIYRYISEYPSERKSSILNEYSNLTNVKEIAEMHYTREVFAEIVTKTKLNVDIFTEIKKEILDLEKKKELGTLDKKGELKLMKLNTRLSLLDDELNKIINLLTVK